VCTQTNNGTRQRFASRKGDKKLYMGLNTYLPWILAIEKKHMLNLMLTICCVMEVIKKELKYLSTNLLIYF
jgi:hypothetical protein